MNILEALKELKAGKKVKRNSEGIKYFIQEEDGYRDIGYLTPIGFAIHCIDLSDLEATDWEVAE